MKLQAYNFTICHKPGPKNQNVDALSRRDYDNTPDPDNAAVLVACDEPKTSDTQIELYYKNQNSIPCVLAADVAEKQPVYTAPEETDDVDTSLPIHPSLLTMEDISKLQKQCTYFKPIIDYICLEELPNNAREARTITAQAQSYVMTDDLYIIFKQPDLEEYHDQQESSNN